MVIKASELTH